MYPCCAQGTVWGKTALQHRMYSSCKMCICCCRLSPTAVPMWSAWIRIQGKPPLTPMSLLRECVYMYNLRTYTVCTSDIKSMSVYWRGCNHSRNWRLVLSNRWTHPETNSVQTRTLSFVEIGFSVTSSSISVLRNGPIRFLDKISAWIIVSLMRTEQPVQLTLFILGECILLLSLLYLVWSAQCALLRIYKLIELLDMEYPSMPYTLRLRRNVLTELPAPTTPLPPLRPFLRIRDEVQLL
jgi:hypothetical protein